MKRLLLRVAGLMVVFGALSVATAQADSHFSVHIGVGVPVAPVVVGPPVAVAPAYPYPAYRAYYRPAPYPGYAWQPGYYVGYRWVPGAWVPHGRVVYAAPHYRGHGYGRGHANHGHR